MHRSRKGHVFSQSTGELLSAGTEVFIRIQVYLHCYYQYFWWSRRIFGINISNQYLFLADAVKHEHFHFYYGMLNSVPLLQLWSSISQEETWRKKKRLIVLQLKGTQHILGVGRKAQPPHQVSSQAAPTVWKQRMVRLLLQSLFKALSVNPRPCNGTATFRAVVFPLQLNPLSRLSQAYIEACFYGGLKYSSDQTDNED